MMKNAFQNLLCYLRWEPAVLRAERDALHAEISHLRARLREGLEETAALKRTYGALADDYDAECAHGRKLADVNSSLGLSCQKALQERDAAVRVSIELGQSITDLLATIWHTLKDAEKADAVHRETLRELADLREFKARAEAGGQSRDWLGRFQKKATNVERAINMGARLTDHKISLDGDAK